MDEAKARIMDLWTKG